MIGISIQLEDQRDRFLPGETIRGTGSWDLDDDPKSVEARLFWYTSGKGAKEVVIADSAVFKSPGRTGHQDFELRLPWGPYSFEGATLSVSWAIEIVVFPLKRAARIDIIVSPNRNTLDLMK